MATSFQEPPPSKDFMNLTDPNVMQWTAYSDLNVNQMGQDGRGYGVPMQLTADSTSNYGFGQSNHPYNENYDLGYSAALNASCPRSYANEMDLTGLPMGVPYSYPPAAYQIEPQRPHEAMDLSDQAINGRQLMQLRDDYDYEYYNIAIKHEQSTGYSSPYDSDVTRSSTPGGDSPMPPYNYRADGRGEEGAVDKEQPYAQLIFRALKEAPDNTMILRDIYDWFKRNTDKASDDEKKGWQNSIRHNLSMNGVRTSFSPLSFLPLTKHRPLRKSTNPAKKPRKASCGASPTKPSAKTASTNAPTKPITTPSPNDKPPAQKAAKQPVAPPACAAAPALKTRTDQTIPSYPAPSRWATTTPTWSPTLRCRTRHTTAPAPTPN
jgi:hypothetical protein